PTSVSDASTTVSVPVGKVGDDVVYEDTGIDYDLVDGAWVQADAFGGSWHTVYEAVVTATDATLGLRPSLRANSTSTGSDGQWELTHIDLNTRDVFRIQNHDGRNPKGFHDTDWFGPVFGGIRADREQRNDSFVCHQGQLYELGNE